MERLKVYLNFVSKSGQVPKLGGGGLVRMVWQKVVIQVRVDTLVM